MRLDPKRQHTLNSVTLVMLTGGCGPFVMVSLVMASGILPIPLSLLFGAGLLIGIAAAVPAGAYGRTRLRFVLLSILAFALTLIAAMSLFLHVQKSGLAHATRYAQTWVAPIEQSRQRSGAWPPSYVHPAPPQLPWPYLATCNREWCKVAGYFVSYRLENGTPHLRVARRDIEREWDWKASRWR